MQVEEQRLVKALKRGEREAQRGLYELYAGRMLAISIRYIGGREQAEDNVHDAFIKVLSSIDQFNYRGAGSLRAWVERITVNSALEWLRVNRRVISLEEKHLVESSYDIENDDVERVPQSTLLRFIAQLPEGYRTVFNLFCVDGYSHREIAQILGINEKSSSSQLLRAKRLLATKIKAYLADE